MCTSATPRLSQFIINTADGSESVRIQQGEAKGCSVFDLSQMASLGWPAEPSPAQPPLPVEGAGADAGRSPATPTLGPRGWPQQPLSSGGQPSTQQSLPVCVMWQVLEVRMHA